MTLNLEIVRKTEAMPDVSPASEAQFRTTLSEILVVLANRNQTLIDNGEERVMNDLPISISIETKYIV